MAQTAPLFSAQIGYLINWAGQNNIPVNQDDLMKLLIIYGGDPAKVQTQLLAAITSAKLTSEQSQPQNPIVDTNTQVFENTSTTTTNTQGTDTTKKSNNGLLWGSLIVGALVIGGIALSSDSKKGKKRK